MDLLHNEQKIIWQFDLSSGYFSTQHIILEE